MFLQLTNTFLLNTVNFRKYFSEKSSYLENIFNKSLNK